MIIAICITQQENMQTSVHPLSRFLCMKCVINFMQISYKIHTLGIYETFNVSYTEILP